jgi:hypothetical protein
MGGAAEVGGQNEKNVPNNSTRVNPTSGILMGMSFR